MRRPLLSILAIATLSFIAPAASATLIPLSATIDCAQATSSGAGCTGVGSATMTFDDVSKLFSWNITFSNLSSPETISHFHGPAVPGLPAAQVFGLPLGDPKIGSTTLNATQEAQLLADLWYINIHTQNFVAGEIRGQVLVPEPSLLGLLGLAAAVPLLARRLRL